jgi:hypothetical protein
MTSKCRRGEFVVGTIGHLAREKKAFVGSRMKEANSLNTVFLASFSHLIFNPLLKNADRSKTLFV